MPFNICSYLIALPETSIITLNKSANFPVCGDPYSQIGEGHGNPLQCSCLENPVDRGAWWAAVYGDTHSRTQLK